MRMTAASLIEALQKVEPNAEISIYGDYGNFAVEDGDIVIHIDAAGKTTVTIGDIL